MIEKSNHAEVLESGQVLVNGRGLPGQTNISTNSLGMLDDVNAQNGGGATGGCENG